MERRERLFLADSRTTSLVAGISLCAAAQSLEVTLTETLDASLDLNTKRPLDCVSRSAAATCGQRCERRGTVNEEDKAECVPGAATPLALALPTRTSLLEHIDLCSPNHGAKRRCATRSTWQRSIRGLRPERI